MLMHPAIPAIQDTLSSKTSIEVISAVAAAVVAAAWVTAFQNVSAQAESGSQAPGIHIDRIDNNPPVANCKHHSWPYYDRSCLWDRGELAAATRMVRIVPIDRVEVPNLIATVAK